MIDKKSGFSNNILNRKIFYLFENKNNQKDKNNTKRKTLNKNEKENNPD